MNFERADASYTAWDQRIVARSQQKAVAATDSAKVSATGVSVQAPPSGIRGTGDRNFHSALSYAADHEHEMDPTWRSKLEESGAKGVTGNSDKESFGFWDLVDIVNPLQHIPLVGTLYRSVTGDEISAPARIMGGALYGGPLGFAASIGNAIMEEATGRDFGDTALAMILDEDQNEGIPADGTLLARGNAAANQPEPAGGDLPATTVVAPFDASDISGEDDPASPRPVATVAAPGNAESEAVARMTANNAALQALLKDMGLAQGSVSSAPSSPATSSEPEPVRPPDIQASMPTAASETPVSERKGRPEGIALNRGFDRQPTGEEPRRSIPIEPTRFMTSHFAHQSAVSPETSTTAASANPAGAIAETQGRTADSKPVDGPDDIGPESTVLQASFADRMLQALDRYQAMSTEKRAHEGSGLEQLGKDSPGAI